MLVRFDHRGAERTMMAEVFAVWAGATEEDAIMLRRWMEQRPPHGSRNFLDFDDEGGDDCGESFENWEAQYRAEMAAAGLSAPQGYADVPQATQH
jgi:hypothetical protein